MDDTTGTRRNSASMRPVFIALVAAFLLGGGLTGYGVYRWLDDRQAPPAPAETGAPVASSVEDAASGPAPTPSASAAIAASEEEQSEAAEAVERVAEQQGGLDQRLAAAEQRLARLDLQSQAAAGNAARAEGLLIAFAARRSVERGVELGYLADQLRLRFGDALPNAVAAVISASRQPVTIDQLLARLDGLAPDLTENDGGISWDRFKSELSSLFVVRRESTPSPQPQRRIDRARLFLQSGRISAAVAEVSALPGASRARRWITDAERLAAAQNALDLIETAAVLEPRMLRDGRGEQIEQASPALAPIQEQNSGQAGGASAAQ
ncbi:hypothetical protein [Qipengyuania spongiae]|uniref:MICOS complex subunit MIC60 n=1 Tax=Qipengyuania spongiae TaxID=2909673 RepID=A0ABY5T260_9SPHN|nr:hypothetical protein [Qipengyuania spongiae]UVI40660.1 MICOS complex subunit MIC60 [Qipengyuania spongiae]